MILPTSLHSRTVEQCHSTKRGNGRTGSVQLQTSQSSSERVLLNQIRIGQCDQSHSPLRRAATRLATASLLGLSPASSNRASRSGRLSRIDGNMTSRYIPNHHTSNNEIGWPNRHSASTCGRASGRLRCLDHCRKLPARLVHLTSPARRLAPRQKLPRLSTFDTACPRAAGAVPFAGLLASSHLLNMETSCHYCNAEHTEQNPLMHGPVYNDPFSDVPDCEDFCYCENCTNAYSNPAHGYFSYCTRCERELWEYAEVFVLEGDNPNNLTGDTACLRCIRSENIKQEKACKLCGLVADGYFCIGFCKACECGCVGNASALLGT